MELPKSLQNKLEIRKANNALRTLQPQNHLIDFATNDYIGFSRNEAIFNKTHQYLINQKIIKNGATGSRLLSGNHSLYQEAERYIAQFHEIASALIFNSGYDANVGFFSSIPQRNDVILYDELCHASIRDGIQMSNAKSFKFKHNNNEDLEQLIQKFQIPNSEIYVATETVFSMDGDVPDLEKLVSLSEKYKIHLIIDEAHALGVFGEKGEGLCQSLGLQDKIFAQIVTFGKGLGCHGAAILGNHELKNYLVNFARSFIYTTGLSPHSVANILVAYQELSVEKTALQQLKNNIEIFRQKKRKYNLESFFVESTSAIQCAIFSGNDKVKRIANQLQEKGFDVKAILSPTVSEGQERLRFCLHSYNSEQEITQVLELLSTFVKKEKTNI